MSRAIPPLPHMSSWHGALSSTGTTLLISFTFTERFLASQEGFWSRELDEKVNIVN
jgi:hypothetical protein